MDNKSELFNKLYKIHLLYVEDDKESRDSMSCLLKEFFQEITIAKNGVDGYTKFKEYPIDLVITDIKMPKLNGIEMAKKIRDIDKDVPIIMLSAYSESKQLLECINMGIHAFLIKPLNIEKFIDTIKKVVMNPRIIEKDIGLSGLINNEKDIDLSGLINNEIDEV